MMDEYQKSIKLKFRILAGFYDLFDLAFLLGKDVNPRRALARKIPNDRIRILDVCVGTANSALQVALANENNRIIGVDISRDMITVAERKIRAEGITNLSIENMNATGMSFEDGEFDVVMVSFGLHEMSYDLMREVLAEMSRVLKSEGSLFIIDYERASSHVMNLCFSLYLRIFEPPHMSEFLDYDWRKILREVGCMVSSTENYRFSKLITAVKCRNPLTEPL